MVCKTNIEPCCSGQELEVDGESVLNHKFKLHQNPFALCPQMKKSNLPTKLCPICSRDFTWRKKWIRVWNNVIYCSETCRRNKSIEWSISFSHKESKEQT